MNQQEREDQIDYGKLWLSKSGDHLPPDTFKYGDCIFENNKGEKWSIDEFRAQTNERIIYLEGLIENMSRDNKVLRDRVDSLEKYVLQF